MAPNLLLIVIDDLNSWIGALGTHPDVRTPNIDALAASGTLFVHAYCNAPYCNASRMSMFTGLLPSTTGIYQDEPFWDQPERPVTFVEELRRAGYYTFGAGKVFHGTFDYTAAGRSRASRAAWSDLENRSFLWDDFRPYSFDPLPRRRPMNGMFDFSRFDRVPEAYHQFDWGPLGGRRTGELPDAAVVAAVTEFLAGSPPQPFLCAAGLYKPHLPWHVPRRYFDLYRRRRLSLPVVKPDDLDDVPPLARQWALSPPDHRLVQKHGQWRHAVQAYLAAISYCDDMVGRILAGLDAGGLADNTAVVLCSDNGFHLGEKLHWRKFALWEEATRVPLVVTAPGGRPHNRVYAPVSLVDVFPTVLELCGIGPDHDPVAPPEGQSLVPFVFGRRVPARRPAVSTWQAGNHSVRSADWRYTRYTDGSEELYDHRVDRHEWTNLAAVPQFDQVRKRMSSWIPGLPQST